MNNWQKGGKNEKMSENVILFKLDQIRFFVGFVVLRNGVFNTKALLQKELRKTFNVVDRQVFRLITNELERPVLIRCIDTKVDNMQPHYEANQSV